MSLTRIIHAELLYISLFCCILLLGAFLYRIAHIVCSLLVEGLVFLPEQPKDPLARFAKNGLLGAALRFVSLIIITALRIMVAAAQIFLTLMYTLTPFVILAFVLVLVHERWNDCMLVLVDILNGDFGDFLREFIMIPLYLLEVIGMYVLPVYNLVVYTLLQMPLQFLMWLLRGEGVRHLIDALLVLRMAAVHLIQEAQVFMSANVDISCPRQTCSNSSVGAACVLLPIDSAAALCLQPTRREFHFLPALDQVRLSVGHLLLYVGASCEALGILGNVTLFPLTDRNTWQALDRFLNGVLHITIGAPTLTMQRCALAGGVQVRPAMCTPDFAPAFAMFARGGYYLGDALTNWLDALYLLVVEQQTDFANLCASVSGLSVKLWQDPVIQRLFGSNQTVLVRLSATAFALTDGTSVVFVQKSVLQKTYAPNLWPSSIQPALGVARVQLPHHGTSDGLLGCVCRDVENVVEVQCTAIAQDGTAWQLPVRWSLSTEVQLLTCNRLRIVVQSLRWTQTRFAAQPPAEQQQQLHADVAIYAIPVCGAVDGVKAMACFAADIHTKGICFPYCMALRLQNEGLVPLVMRGAAEWESGVLMVMRDCVPTLSATEAPQAEAVVRTTCAVQQEALSTSFSTSVTGSECRYAYACSTFVLNKSSLPGYDDQGAAAATTTSDGGVHLVLQEQPLVVAGGVQLRATDSHVEFPMLVGNQFNEFTVETVGVGIPLVTRKAPVPKMEAQYEEPMRLYPPHDYLVGGNIPYNPAALSLDSLWYASNPSYEWISAMAEYCASRGVDASTQIMFLSNYAPIRLWKVLYQSGNCYVASDTLQRVCRKDVAMASSLDPAREIPVLDADNVRSQTQLYQMCASDQTFNLWVESMEYFDELNIAVGVRRGSMADLGRLSGGHTVFYFVHSLNISQVREAEPWTAELPSVYSLPSCPAFKVLPDIGGVVGHSVATVARLLAVPVNFVFNPFAIVELLDSRGMDSCPQNALQHTALDNCGMSLLSLTAFFNELYITNDLAWDVGAWLVAHIIPTSSTSTEAQTFRSFLQGSLIVGDATKVVGLYNVIHVVEFMDSGAQDVLLGRRLLGDKSKAFFHGLFTSLRSGSGSLLSLGQSVVGLASMSFSAGSNFGILLSSQSATAQYAGAAVAAPAIAWAQFTYESALPIVLDVLGFAKINGQLSAATVWVSLHDVYERYDAIIDTRTRRACAGLRVMLGYTSSLGKALYYNCLAGVEMTGGIVHLILTVMIDLPLYRCLCVNSAGQDYLPYAQTHCMTLVPPTRKGFWQNTLASLPTLQAACALYSASIDKQVMTAFDSWVTHAQFSAESISSFLDEFLVSNAQAGTCSSTLSNPSAIVLTPLPLSHYHVCTRTQTCAARCQDAIRIFQWELTNLQTLGYSVHAPANTFDVTVESPMFNRYGSSAFASISTIVSMASVNTCSARCTFQCLAVAKQDPQTNRIRVEFFCVPDPAMILSTVSSTGMDSFEITDLDTLLGLTTTSDAVTLQTIDFALQRTRLFVVLYVVRRSNSLTSLQSASSTLVVSHEIFIYQPDGAGGAKGSKLLSSDDLATETLTANIKNALWGDRGAASFTNAEVDHVSLTSVTEIASGKEGSLVFFISFSARIKSSGDERSYNLHAIVRYDCNHICQTSIVFYPTCAQCYSQEQCNKETFCHWGLDKAIALGKQGILLHVEKQMYLFVPSLDEGAFLIQTSVDKPQAKLVYIDPARGWLGDNKTLSMSRMLANQALMGSWTRASVFSTLGTPRPARDVFTTSSGGGAWGHQSSIIFPSFFQAASSGIAWLQQIRFTQGVNGLALKASSSMPSQRTATVETACTVHSCVGCTNARLRLMCHAAQNCMLSKCLGTVVQTSNLMCGIGGMLEQTYLQAITTWHAMFMMGAELGLLVAKGLTGHMLKVITLKFPTEQFYSLVCACKDMMASMVGLGMTIGRTLSGLLTGRGLDLTGHQDVGTLAGEDTLKTSSLGGLFFNLITGSSLLPVLAMHKWLLCMANASLAATTEIGITITFADVEMDTSWMQCARLGAVFDVLNNNDIQNQVGNSVQMFVSFVISLTSGIGDTVLYGMELFFDCSIDFLIGIVFSIQDILYTYNLRACKVPNYAMRYVMWCACGDQAYMIPEPQRSHGLADGALWCVGTLSMILRDGTTGIVWNPYNLNQLSAGVSGLTSYIDCISSSIDSRECAPPPMQDSLLPDLVAQGVEPIAVWARCKGNYMQNMWDIGAGALFASTDAPSIAAETMRLNAQGWAQQLGAEFEQCMRDPGRMQIDYGVCMTLFFDIKQHSTPAAYFLYNKAPPHNNLVEPPDACMVFSGLNQTAPLGEPLQVMMQDCVLQEGVGRPEACDLNPLVWSGTQPQKTSAANLHGTVPDAGIINTNDLYQPLQARLRAAIDAFNRTYTDDAHFIDTVLFSADGDFFHDFFDCMYLGPYTRVDLLACDAEGLLECPFYARDNQSGFSRAFTPCFGEEAMDGDYNIPFTCGSQARRSLIKYFFRNFSSSITTGLNISLKIQDKVQALLLNYTDARSMGCYDNRTRQCRLEACTLDNGFNPCLESHFELSSEDVGDYIVQNVLEKDLPAYYHLSMVDVTPWTAYYQHGGRAPQPAQWSKDAASATIAQENGLFAPHVPIVHYDEVYSMPSWQDPLVNRTHGSLWGLCTSLLSQATMSLPLDKTTERPLGATGSLRETEAAVRAIVQQAMEHSPFVWHRARRHAPSPSAVCRRSKMQQIHRTNSRLKVTPPQLRYDDASFFTLYATEEESLPYFGFLEGQLGEAADTCVCALDAPSKDQCIVLPETCASFLETNYSVAVCQKTLLRICASTSKVYLKSEIPQVMACLRQLPGVRCPELGPSDRWGLFPLDCVPSECSTAAAWVGRAGTDQVYEGIRFVTEGRAGLRLPNYRHVNRTFHSTIHYAQQQTATKEEAAQPRCWDVPDLAPSEAQEDDADFADDFLKTLFPAAQLMFESPVTSTCTRFVLEVARAEALSHVGVAVPRSVARWRRRCSVKIRQFSMCHMMGLYYDVPPPPSPPFCTSSWRLQENSKMYLTPNCIVVDPVRRRMYDGHACAAGRSITLLTDADLTDACLLTLPRVDSAYSMLFTEGRARLSEAEELTELRDSLQDLLKIVTTHTATDHVSHVLDWWPDDVDMPPGFHPTAATDPAELAPAVFDSHYLYDHTNLFYAHSIARNGSLLYRAAGAAGLCRVPSLGMPLFETNTNRICTRMSKRAATDTPHMPVDMPLHPGSTEEVWPYTTNYIQTHFDPEFCSSAAEEVPWQPHDFQSQTAGGIPGWQQYAARINEAGQGVYSETKYPPLGYALSELPSQEEDTWGPCTLVQWGAAIVCTPANSAGQCPQDVSSCLSLEEANHTSLPGVCFSNAAYTLSTERPPCFRSTHCPHDSVCLVDGGCAPLYLHVWNEARNAFDMEVSVLADRCGFGEAGHPFTQTMRGASPWEHVPDVLHAHGMCAHRHWFAYRHALKSQVCSATPTGDVLACNASETEWPWIQQRFDDISATERQTMAQGNMLLTHPHPCDTNIFHLQYAQRRLQVCSGFEGQHPTTTPDAYMHYELSTSSEADANGNSQQSWAGVEPIYSDWANTSQWLRTYDEVSEKVHVGALLHTEEWDQPLGFLGANRKADGVMGSMANDHWQEQVEFFRCAERLACTNPAFTFHGHAHTRRNPLTGNFSEASLRRCGAIGYLSSTADFCQLDIHLFPLLLHLLTNEEGGACSRFWTRGWFVMGSQLPLTAELAPQTLYCSSAPLACTYAARASTRLTTVHESDSIMIITQKLNDMLRGAGQSVRNVAQVEGVTRTYGYIHRCLATIADTTEFYQSHLQTDVYKTAGTSGVYVALRLTLYEIPLAWLRHAMLVTLLSTVDDQIVAPALPRLGFEPVDLMLWGNHKKQRWCSVAAELERHPLLLAMLCQDLTMETEKADEWAQRVQADMQNAVANKLVDEHGNADVYCFSTLRWRCNAQASANLSQQCQRALVDAYTEASCPPATDVTNNPFWDVCAHAADLYDIADPELVPLRDLPQNSVFDSFVQRCREALLDLDVAFPVDFLGTVWSDVVDDASRWEWAPAVRVWAIDIPTFLSRINHGFDMTQWLQTQVCRAEPSDLCRVSSSSVSSSMEESACMYSYEAHGDLDKYLLPSSEKEEPVVRITYADGTTDDFAICQFLTVDNDVCVLQHPSNRSRLNVDEETSLVTCDIVQIDAPPGVEVQGFVLERTLQQWHTMLSSYSSYTGASMSTCLEGGLQCTWNRHSLNDDPTPHNAWWYHGWNTPAAADRFQPLQLHTDSMGDPWLASDSDRGFWQSKGCGQFSSVCALRIRLETQLPHSKGFCLPPTAPPPSCAQALLSDAVSAFRVIQGAKHTLYRCAECTRYSKVALRQKHVGCFLSRDEGKSQEEQLTSVSIAQTLSFLHHSDEMVARMQTEVWPRAMHNGSAMDIMLPIGPDSFVKRTMYQWASCDDDDDDCYWTSDDFAFYRSNDLLIWDKAVRNPNLPNTMVCKAQPYTADDYTRCNDATDRRRQSLAAFVEKQYRQTNGVWMPTLAAGTGLAWRSNVAHPQVSLFSLFYASRTRPKALLQWILGQDICRDATATLLQDRICVQSRHSEDRFEAMHPWLGGHFNPFEGLDECMSSSDSAYMCSCQCSPQRVCEALNYSEHTMQCEFPTTDACLHQLFAPTRTMSVDDSTHLCEAIRRTSLPTQCLHPQGLLGGELHREAVTLEQLHGREGIPTSSSDFLIQSMYDIGKNGLWAGRTLLQERVHAGQKYAFLRMQREHLQPAHVAFGLNLAFTGQPLVVRAMALLPYRHHRLLPLSLHTSLDWVMHLDALWQADVDRLIQPAYPTQQQQHQGDWTCPLRAVAFWGGTHERLAPMTPNPVLMRLLYPELKGAHPLIQTTSLRPLLAKYQTTNGACFYEKGAWRITRIPIADAQNPCGLLGMLRALHQQLPVISRVVTPFASRCMAIVDTPDVGAPLRSGETMPPSRPHNGECGVLHRLTPFLMSTRGDVGAIRVMQQGLTTHSEGGDCHMGRALLAQREDVVGRLCALASKNASHGIATCADGTQQVSLRRAQPLRLEALVQKKERLYRNQMKPTAAEHLPPFRGPGGVFLPQSEVSYGLLYAVSPRRALANDLLQHVTPTAAWRGSEFWTRYLSGTLPFQRLNDTIRPSTLTHAALEAQQRNASQTRAQASDDALWSASAWTWASTNGTFVGSVDKSAWLRDRFGACNASYFRYGRRTVEKSVKPISLCEPAPTGSLQTLCLAMAQYRADVASVNCQIRGQGQVCLYKPAMFYLPYMWSPTNQEFLADTVLQYYRDIVNQPRFAASSTSFSALCPSRNQLMAKLAELSRQQAENCPANQVDYLKRILNTMKKVGHDVLYMGYCATMAVANVLGLVFAQDGAEAYAMTRLIMHYLTEVISTAGNIIMPILNAIIELLFGTSSAGKVIKEIFRYLCEAYNRFMEYVFRPVWCFGLKPIIYTFFQIIRGIVSIFSSSGASTVDSIWSAIAGGDSGYDADACFGSFRASINCNSQEAPEPNGSLFLTQAFATRCWTNTLPGGSLASDSYLACTASDTCALDPLYFDSYDDGGSRLVACAMCPPIPLGEGGQTFGCNTYLKRCTCGVSAVGSSECMSNGDCAIMTRTTCSVASNIDFVRDAVTTVPCDQCGGLSAESMCVMDGSGATGLCACVTLRHTDTLQTCDASLLGARVHLLGATGQCFVTLDQDVSPTLVAALPFSSLSIAPCMLGRDNICLRVGLPLTSGGEYQSTFPVLLGISSGLIKPQFFGQQDGGSSSTRGRRLLASTDFRRNDFCAQALREKDRNVVKWCMHWHYVANATILRYNLTALQHDDTLLLQPLPHLVWSLLQNTEALQQLVRAPGAIRAVIREFPGLWPHMAELLLLWPLEVSTSSSSLFFTENHTKKTCSSNSTMRRKVLQAQEGDSYYTDPVVAYPITQCAALQVPINKIITAFQVTVRFYEHGSSSFSSSCFSGNNNNNNTTCVVSDDYQLPPSTITTRQTDMLGSVADALLLIPSGGLVSGSRLMDALMSNISYDDAMANNYITGRRLIKELSSCNFTTLTLGPSPRQLLPLVLTLVAVFVLLTLFVSPNTFITWGLWVFVFPAVLFWSAYHLSPLCWPMVPPRLPRDLAAEIKTLIPDDLEIPTFMVHANCSMRGVRFDDNTYDPAFCFKQCADDPFFMTSWQDSVAWWLCEIHVPACLQVAHAIGSSGMMGDMVSSLHYYADVLQFESLDADFVRAHRLCALFTCYHLIFAVICAAFALMLLPSLCLAVAELFTGALNLLMEAYNSEMV